jgi:hypothetical protein
MLVDMVRRREGGRSWRTRRRGAAAVAGKRLDPERVARPSSVSSVETKETTAGRLMDILARRGKAGGRGIDEVRDDSGFGRRTEERDERERENGEARVCLWGRGLSYPARGVVDARHELIGRVDVVRRGHAMALPSSLHVREEKAGCGWAALLWTLKPSHTVHLVPFQFLFLFHILSLFYNFF